MDPTTENRAAMVAAAQTAVAKAERHLAGSESAADVARAENEVVRRELAEARRWLAALLADDTADEDGLEDVPEPDEEVEDEAPPRGRPTRPPARDHRCLTLPPRVDDPGETEPDLVVGATSDRRWIEDRRTGTVHHSSILFPGGPLTAPLGEALRFLAKPGSRILVVGDRHPPTWIGKHDVWEPRAAFWEDGPVHDVAIFGERDGEARIGQVYVSDDLGAVDEILFQRLTIWNGNLYGPALAALIVEAGSRIGTLRLYDVKLDGERVDHIEAGYPYRFGIRSQGEAGWDCRNVDVAPANAHGFYHDSVIGLGVWHRCTVRGAGRTGFQLTDRALYHAAPAVGHLLLEGCRVENVDNHYGGGSDYTIAGRQGLVVLRDCESIGGEETSNAAFVAWADAGNGLFPNPRGFVVNEVHLEGFRAYHPKGNRPIVALSGVELAHLYGFEIEGPWPAIEFPSEHGGMRSGRLVLHQARPSRYRGFKGPGPKIRVYEPASAGATYPPGSGSYRVLSDDEIDALAAPRR